MPTYALKCDGCGLEVDAFHAMAEGHGDCPRCDHALRVDWSRQPAPATVAHDLHGTRMRPMDIQAQPREVPKLREMYGNIGRCWNADGSVTFTHKDDAKAFYRKDQEIRKKFRDLKGEGKRKDKKHAIRDKAGNVLSAPAKKKGPPNT